MFSNLSKFFNTKSNLYIIKTECVACTSNTMLMTIAVLINIAFVQRFLQENLRKIKFNWYLLALSVCELIMCLILLIDCIFSKVPSQPIFLNDFKIYTFYGIYKSFKFINLKKIKKSKVANGIGFK